MVEVNGTRVRLRSVTLEDVEPLAAAVDSDPTNLGPGGEAARERLRKQVERNPTLDDGGFVDLAIEADGRLVGNIQARMPRQAFPGGVCEIGISLFPDARGHGYGRDAVTLFTEYLFGEGVDRVQASTSADNAAMRRVLELVGYHFEGVLRSYGPAPDGGREDYAMYAAIRGDRLLGSQSSEGS
ncbi:MAG: GNAT family N-acetyltransferase [Actinomycetota bacterium]|nr:GNAT family N-acetyltransferase [Actinomycetota bacterium]